MPINSRLNELVRLLLAAMDREKIHWTDTSEADTFRATLSSGIVRLSKFEDQLPLGASPVYQLVVMDQKNQVIEEFRTSDSEETAMLNELYRKVRGKALNLDNAWDVLVRELKQKAET